MSKPNRIFISYRRDGGDGMAGRVRDALRQRGYDVFLDVEDLKTGKFNEALLAEIDGCTDFLVILSANSLDRCRNEGDWVRLEIAYALKQKKNIVPVLGRKFQFPQELPDDIEDLRHYNGIGASHELFDASMDRLVSLLRSRPRPAARAWLAGTVGIVLLGIALAGWQFWSHSDTESTTAHDLEPTRRIPLSSPERHLQPADFDQLGNDLAQSMLAALGQKRLLYKSDGPLQLVLDRVVNHTMRRIETDLVMKKLRADLTASGSIEFPASNSTLDELRAINAIKNGPAPSASASAQEQRYMLNIKISEWKDFQRTTYTMLGTLTEVATSTEVWRDSVELKKP